MNVQKTFIRLMKVQLGCFAYANVAKQQTGKAETFTFPGFTPICGQRRSDGGGTVWRHTISKRLNQKVTAIKQTIKDMRAQPLNEQGQWLRSVVRG